MIGSYLYMLSLLLIFVLCACQYCCFRQSNAHDVTDAKQIKALTHENGSAATSHSVSSDLTATKHSPHMLSQISNHLSISHQMNKTVHCYFDSPETKKLFNCMGDESIDVCLMRRIDVFESSLYRKTPIKEMSFIDQISLFFLFRLLLILFGYVSSNFRNCVNADDI